MSKTGKYGTQKNEKKGDAKQLDFLVQNPKQKITSYLSTIQQRIMHEIDEKKQPLPQKQSPFFEDQDEKVKRKNMQQLKKLSEEKKKTELKLKQLADKQYEIEHEYRLNLKSQYQTKGYTERVSKDNKEQGLKRSKGEEGFMNEFLETTMPPMSKGHNVRSLRKIRPKSELTVQDIQTLKKLKEEYKKFQAQVASKTSKYNQQLERISKQNAELDQMMNKEKSDKKRKQIQERIKQLQSQKIERMKKFQEQKFRFYEAKRKPKKYESMVKEFQSKEKQIEESKIEKMKERLKRKMLDLEEINEHEKRYRQMREESLKFIEQKYIHQSRLLKDSHIEVPYVSRYHFSIAKEQKQRKEEKKKREMATIQKCQRIKEYAAKVQEEYAPKVKTVQNQEDEEHAKSQVSLQKGLSIEERKHLGNNYLKSAIEEIKKKQTQRSTLTTKSTVSNLPAIQSTSTKYKDYLAESRKRYQSPQEKKQENERRSKRKYDNSVSEVKKIMENESNFKGNKYEVVEKIKEIAERLQHDPNDRNYMARIRAKLQILQTIT